MVNACKIVFEIGPTLHDELSAQKLIEIAAESGADAVKVQILNADKLLQDKNQTFSYGILQEDNSINFIEENLYSILKRRELQKEAWIRLSEYASRLKIDFYATVTDQDDLNWIVDLHCQAIKIASSDLTFTPLIKSASKLGKQMHIDTGTGTFEEINHAVETIRAEGNDDIVIHHCPPGYPAPDEKIFLESIPYIKEKFGAKVGFSDHSLGWHMDIAALCFGASVLEKTLTLNRGTRSPEHVFSIEPRNAKDFVQTIRSVEKAINSGVRQVSAEDQLGVLPNRRSAYFANNFNFGHILVESDVVFRRPGIHLDYNRTSELFGKKLRKSVEIHNPVRMDDFID